MQLLVCGVWNSILTTAFPNTQGYIVRVECTPRTQGYTDFFVLQYRARANQIRETHFLVVQCKRVSFEHRGRKLTTSANTNPSSSAVSKQLYSIKLTPRSRKADRLLLVENFLRGQGIRT
jgi:hypothetical protein